MIDKSIEEKETLLLQKRLKQHYSLMMNFIRTKAEPTIFYLPAKHTPRTEQLLKETRVAIRHKVASLEADLQDDEGEVLAEGDNGRPPRRPVEAESSGEEEGKSAGDDSSSSSSSD